MGGKYLNTKITNNTIRTWAKETNTKRQFTEQDIQVANMHMKRCSASLLIRKMQSKTTISITCNNEQNRGVLVQMAMCQDPELTSTH